MYYCLVCNKNMICMIQDMLNNFIYCIYFITNVRTKDISSRKVAYYFILALSFMHWFVFLWGQLRTSRLDRDQFLFWSFRWDDLIRYIQPMTSAATISYKVHPLTQALLEFCGTFTTWTIVVWRHFCSYRRVVYSKNGILYFASPVSPTLIHVNDNIKIL